MAEGREQGDEQDRKYAAQDAADAAKLAHGGIVRGKGTAFIVGEGDGCLGHQPRPQSWLGEVVSVDATVKIEGAVDQGTIQRAIEGALEGPDRSGTIQLAGTTLWEHTFSFPPPRTVLSAPDLPFTYTLELEVAPVYEDDPFHDAGWLRYAHGGWRQTLKWMRACVGYSWREATGTLREVSPLERWALYGVRLNDAAYGYEFGVDVGGVPRQEQDS